MQKTLSGGEAETTNNRMELLAVIKGLKALKEPCKVTLYSDSKYVINVFNEGWAFNKTFDGYAPKKPDKIKNLDLWDDLFNALKGHEVEFVWVKGHSDNEFNNLCDIEARKHTKQ